jgi:hypothetical protein
VCAVSVCLVSVCVGGWVGGWVGVVCVSVCVRERGRVCVSVARHICY